MSEEAPYSYQRGAGAPLSHQPSTRSTRLRRHSLRFALPHDSEPQISLEEHDSDHQDADFCLPRSPTAPELDNTDSDTSTGAPSDTADDYIQLDKNTRTTRSNLTASAPPASASAPKKKSKGKKKKTSARVEEVLQGLGPVQPRLVPPTNASDEEPTTRVFGSVLHRTNDSQLGAPSVYWQYLYPLQSEIQPESYSLDAVPILKKSPAGVPYIGCRICNAPPPGQTKSQYVTHYYFQPDG
jgi:hypothetical protein